MIKWPSVFKGPLRPAVQLRAVNKAFGAGASRVAALNTVNFSAYPGELLLLAGPSGCGKTTLLCLVAGLLDADSGSVTVFEHSLEKLSVEAKSEFRRNNIGFVFQHFNLIPVLSAAENAAVPLLIAGVPRKQALERAEKLLAEMGLSHRTTALPSMLSGGEQQRVAIARALVANPRLLICDEPTAALDGDTGAKVMALLRGAAQNAERAVIVVTHDSRTFRYGDRIVHMSDGKIASVQQHEMEFEAREETAAQRKEVLPC